MALLLIHVDGVHRNTREELEPLVRSLESVTGYFRVRVVYAEKRRYGGGPGFWPELLDVWLPEASKYLAGAVTPQIVKWAVGRIRERSNRRVTVNLYGPDGRIIKEVRVDQKMMISEKDYPDPAKAHSRRRPACDE